MPSEVRGTKLTSKEIGMATPLDRYELDLSEHLGQ